jgi:hypothetical protein
MNFNAITKELLNNITKVSNNKEILNSVAKLNDIFESIERMEQENEKFHQTMINEIDIYRKKLRKNESIVQSKCDYKCIKCGFLNKF